MNFPGNALAFILLGKDNLQPQKLTVLGGFQNPGHLIQISGQVFQHHIHLGNQSFRPLHLLIDIFDPFLQLIPLLLQIIFFFPGQGKLKLHAGGCFIRDPDVVLRKFLKVPAHFRKPDSRPFIRQLQLVHLIDCAGYIRQHGLKLFIE
ncbi:hypothetical protein D3C75_928940 [compost metagenome]